MSLKSLARPGLGCALLIALASPLAQAHVVLAQKSAEAGSYYRATFQVGHGCAGSATTAVEIRLPAGVQGAKPMPKPGWTLRRELAPLATPYESHGRTVTEEVRSIRWQGGPLADADFDEFVVQIKLPAQPGPLWFEVRQDCEAGRIDWVERPASGTDTRGLKGPAALLDVRPAAAAPHAH